MLTIGTGRSLYKAEGTGSTTIGKKGLLFVDRTIGKVEHLVGFQC